MDDVSVDVHLEIIDVIAASEDTRRLVAGTVEPLTQSLRASAPVRTGAGRSSIRGVVERDFETGWVGKVSWDDEHYYMGIQNSRTRWAEPTVQRVRYV